MIFKRYLKRKILFKVKKDNLLTYTKIILSFLYCRKIDYITGILNRFKILSNSRRNGRQTVLQIYPMMDR